MAAGEYVSMSAQRELLIRELGVERRAIERDPETEREELASIFTEQGVTAATATIVAEELMRDPESAVRAHAREELGINPDELGAPVSAAVASLISFGIGALLPLLPWFFVGGEAALVTSVAVALCAIATTGAIIGYLTGQSLLHGAARQVIIAAMAGAVTYSVGKILGVATA
jgi:vacuolar iron transporter family protein